MNTVQQQEKDISQIMADLNTQKLSAQGNLNAFNIQAFGVATILAPSGPFTNQTFTKTIPHRLGYQPIFICYYFDPNTNVYFRLPFVTFNGVILAGAAPSQHRSSFFAYADDQNLYLNARCMNSLAPTPAVVDLNFTYYILDVPALTHTS